MISKCIKKEPLFREDVIGGIVKKQVYRFYLKDGAEFWASHRWSITRVYLKRKNK